MIKDAGSKFDDYSILSKIKQVLLYWGYELTEKDFFITSTNYYIKMSYCQFTRKEVLQKAKERYSKKSCRVLFQKQRSNKRKVKNLIQKLFKRRKRQY